MSNNSLLTSSPEETELFTAQIKNALLELPQVIDLAQAPTFLTGFSSTNLFPNLKNDFESIPSVHFLNVDDRYFNIMNQKFIIGRNFTQIEVKNGQPIAIINNILANKISTYNTSIGKKIRISDNSQLYTIIGVVNSVKSPANNLIPPRIYLPTKQTNLNFIIKLQANQQLSSGEIKRMVQKTNNGYLVTIFTDMNTLKNNYLIKQKIAAYSSIVLSFFTLFIAAIGLYGILSYSTQMRRFEIGTRMAIGAKRGDLIRLIIKDNAKAILLGIGISVLLLTGFALGFNKQLEPYLTWQLIPLFLVTLGLVSLISFAACYLPLRQYINKPAMYSLRGSE